MKNKPFEMCMLYDFYGEILTPKQKELFDLYYNDDLSLSEISEHMGITRQGVRDGIVRAEHTLRATEKKLGLVAKYGKTRLELERLTDIVLELHSLNSAHYQDVRIAKLCDQALQIAKQLSE